VSEYGALNTSKIEEENDRRGGGRNSKPTNL